MTTSDLAYQAEIPETTFQDWERGPSNPATNRENRIRVRKIAETLDIEVCDLRDHDVRYLSRLLAVFLLDEDK